MTSKNPLPNDTTKEIILGELSSVRSSRKMDDELQPAKIQSKKCVWTTKNKVLLAFGVFFIIAAALSVGLYFGLKHKLEPVGPINKVNLINDEYVHFGEFELKQRNLFSSDITQKMILTQAIRKKASQTSRLLQEEGQDEEIVDYSATVNLDHIGFQLTHDSNSQLGVQVDSERLFDYLMANQPGAARLLQEVMQIDDVNEAASVQQLQQQMSQLFNDELGTFGKFQFHETPIVELKLNQSSSNYEILDQNGVPVKDARRLLIIRILFFKELFAGIKKVVQTIVRPVVQLVRDHGSLIGKVAGGIIGFIAGGPAGAELGMKIGEGVGLAAQTFVKACVPKDVLTIRCTGDSIKQAGIDLAVDLGKKVLTSAVSSVWDSFAK